MEIALETGDIVRPDVAGWRRERSPERPSGMPVKLRPDWICEVLSPSNASDEAAQRTQVEVLLPCAIEPHVPPTAADAVATMIGACSTSHGISVPERRWLDTGFVRSCIER